MGIHLGVCAHVIVLPVEYGAGNLRSSRTSDQITDDLIRALHEIGAAWNPVQLRHRLDGKPALLHVRQRIAELDPGLAQEHVRGNPKMLVERTGHWHGNRALAG